MIQKQKSWGGRREGAGAKKKKLKDRKKSVVRRIPIELVKEVDSLIKKIRSPIAIICVLATLLK